MSLRRSLWLVAASVVATSSGHALAQDASAEFDRPPGAYVTVGVGGTWASDPSLSRSVGSMSDVDSLGYSWHATPDLDGGFGLGAGIGYDFGNNVRAELTYELGTYGLGKIKGGADVNDFGDRYRASFSGGFLEP